MEWLVQIVTSVFTFLGEFCHDDAARIRHIVNSLICKNHKTETVIHVYDFVIARLSSEPDMRTLSVDKRPFESGVNHTNHTVDLVCYATLKFAGFRDFEHEQKFQISD